MDQGSNKNHSPAYNFTPTVTKFCVMWEGLSLPHDTKFGNCRCKIVDSRSFHSWSLIHGLRWSGLIKVGPDLTTELYLWMYTHPITYNKVTSHGDQYIAQQWLKIMASRLPAQSHSLTQCCLDIVGIHLITISQICWHQLSWSFKGYSSFRVVMWLQ